VGRVFREKGPRKKTHFSAPDLSKQKKGSKKED